MGKDLRVDELPRIRSVETTNPYRGDEFRLEVGEVDPVPSIGSWLQWLPVRYATAGPAMDSAQCLVPPYVPRSSLRMPRNFDSTELEIHPRPVDATAQRAIAISGNFRRRRQDKLDRTAVT